MGKRERQTVEAGDAAALGIAPDEPELLEASWRWLLWPAAVMAGAACGLAIWQAAAPQLAPAPQVVVRAVAEAPVSRDPAAATPGGETAVGLAPLHAQAIRRADFAGVRPSAPVRRVADWAVDARDALGLPFAIVDKRQARVYVFEPGGRLAGSAPILLGYARGDHTVPDIGTRKLADVKPGERTTPAGRFVAEHGRNLKGEDIVWVDYDAAVSMHRVRATNAAERRLQRLATPTPADNRISYGCINLPADFYERVLAPTFAGPRAIVYVLPETRPLAQVFERSYDVDARERRLARAQRLALLAAR